MKEILKIEDITITVTWKNIKNMYLRVLPPNGDVEVSAPIALPQEKLVNFIKSKKQWILKKQDIILKNDIKAPLKYKNDEKHYLWGKQYNLKLISNDNIKSGFVKDDTIFLPVSKRSTIDIRQKVLVELYRRELQNKIPTLMAKHSKIIGKKPSEVKVRKMKNWGNCRKDGRITLNLNLAKKDPKCLEYVIIHELCHLIEFNHGKEFKKLMDKYCPDWKKIKKELNE